ncbi:apoptosis-stimulating of p53 protein 2b [Chaetodon auriga]|uniref:apoptosis-stimulating of p53 protein 2b n=1 Tax=Chaetodon auriga TaxID=39042 RepID=UPI004032AAE5
MMPMFLTVYLSNNDQHFSEVPITPETLCRDVVELCKEPGEADCYLAEMWRGSERVVGEGERMLEVLQRWGQQRGEVRYLLHHQRAPGRESGGSRAADQMMKRNQVKASVERCLENGVSAPRLDMTLSDLQDLATRQQQQINAQQQLLASKEQRLRYLKLQDQRQQQQEVSEQERLRQLRENAHNQEAKLRRVRALRGQVEQKRLSNSKLVEEIEQMTGLFQQKQRELLVAVSRVEELSDQLEALRSNRLEPPPLPHHHTTAAELERLYKELQLRNKLNQDQSGRLQQQRDSLNKKNLEVAAMDRRLAELRQRLWKKKAALQQKENLPVASDGVAPQHGVVSRVAAVGPYIQSSSTTSSQGPPVPGRQEVLMKPAYPDGTATLPMPDSSLKPPPRPVKPASGFTTSKITKLSDWSGSFSESSEGYSHASTLPRMSSLSCHNSGGKTLTDQKGLSGSDIPPPVPSRTNHITENLLKDNQASGKGLSKLAVPPPVPSKPKPFSSSGPPPFSKPPYNTGTFPGKVRPVGGHLRAPGVLSSHSHTLPLPNKQESPPAAAIRPYTPDLSDAPLTVLQKPQTLAASSIYSMYTQQATPGKGYQGQGTLPRSQPRVYGKPVLHQSVASDSAIMNSGSCVSDGLEVDSSCSGNGDGVGAETAERATPRPLSPTKLLPFLSNPHRNPSDADLEALRRRLHHAPRPLKKRSSITEPEGPAGPNIQKLLYQKTTLAAMETIPMETISPAGTYAHAGVQEGGAGGADAMFRVDDNTGTGSNQPLADSPEDSLTPPPLPPRSPIPDPTSCRALPPPLEDKEEEEEEVCPSTSVPPDYFAEEFPPYPPPPYPSSCDGEQGEDVFNLQPPEVTGQVTVPPGKKSILRKASSEQIDHSIRVKFNPLALLLDSSLEGEYDLVQRVIYDVEDPSMPNDEGITALHNAVCAGHTEIVKFLVQFGVNANAADSDGWTPLHCAASCNNVQVCKFLVESGAAVFATTYSDMQTAADKCEEMEDGYAQCSQFLYGVQEKMGVMNRGVVYALWDYEPQNDDELAFSEGDCMTVLRREDEVETEWWWARCGDREGYIPRNLLGLYLRIKPRQRSLA